MEVFSKLSDPVIFQLRSGCVQGWRSHTLSKSPVQHLITFTSKCFWYIGGIPHGMSWGFGSGVFHGFHGRHDLNSQMYLCPSWAEIGAGILHPELEDIHESVHVEGGYNIFMECCHIRGRIWTGRMGQAEKFLFGRSALIGCHG